MSRSDDLSQMMRHRMSRRLEVLDDENPDHPWLPAEEYFVSPDQSHPLERWDFGGFKGRAKHLLPSTLVTSVKILTPCDESPSFVKEKLRVDRPYWTGPMVVLEPRMVSELCYSSDGGENAPLRIALPEEIACAMAQHPHAGSYSSVYSLLDQDQERIYHTYNHPTHKQTVVKVHGSTDARFPQNLLFVRTIPGQKEMLGYRKWFRN